MNMASRDEDSAARRIASRLRTVRETALASGDPTDPQAVAHSRRWSYHPCMAAWIRNLRDRKVVQWTLAYAGAAWFVLEAVSMFADRWEWPAEIGRATDIVLLVGLALTLTLAWFHGEKGRQRVSPGEATLLALLLLTGGFALFILVPTVDPVGSPREGAPRSSVAVLPFQNLSADQDQEYFSAGLTEEIINALTQIPDLKVSARTSAFAFQDSDLDIRTIADSLGVAHVLEGSVRKEGNQIRVMATLVEAESGFQLWSDTYDRELTGIFAIQDEIARAITDQLQVTLSGDEQTTLVAEATESTEAYEAYLRGRYLWNQRTEAGLLNAITQFQRAVELDSEYAEAYSGLADSYLLLDFYAPTLEDQNLRRNLAPGIDAAQNAVRLAPGLAMPHASLGWGLFMIGEWQGAEQEFERAIELNPGYATAQQWYGIFLFATGRADEGVIHTSRAVELDPVSPAVSRTLGQAFFAAGRTEEAVEQMRKTTELAPGAWYEWSELTRGLTEAGEYDEGLEAWDNYVRTSGVDPIAAREAYQAVTRYSRSGEPQEVSHFDANVNTLVWLYAHTGQLDRATELIQDYHVRPGGKGHAAQAHVLWASEELRDDPSYQVLLEEAGITW